MGAKVAVSKCWLGCPFEGWVCSEVGGVGIGLVVVFMYVSVWLVWMCGFEWVGGCGVGPGIGVSKFAGKNIVGHFPFECWLGFGIVMMGMGSVMVLQCVAVWLVVMWVLVWVVGLWIGAGIGLPRVRYSSW